MPDDTSPVTREQLDHFKTLLSELTGECHDLIGARKSLEAEVVRLRKENARLKDELIRKNASSGLSQKDRLVLKQHLSSLIKRIDHHLEEKV